MPVESSSPTPSAWLHRWAWVLACATFPLVWWGGFVTSTDAGMAFRDWLTSDGHFMLFYPWLSSTGDKFVEHGHRLLAVAVGILAIGLVVLAHRTGARRNVVALCWVVLGAVIGQGVLGGMRVVLDQRTLALVHGCTGPLFFGLTAATVVVTSPRWTRLASAADSVRVARLARLAAVCAAVAYFQLIAGAIVRHTPQMLAPAAASLFQVAVYFHLLLAGLLLLYTAAFAWTAWRAGHVRRVATMLVGLLVCQIALGVATWLVKYGVPRPFSGWVGDLRSVNVEASTAQAVIVTSHVATGSLILAVSVVAVLITARLSGWLPLRLRSVPAVAVEGVR